jgi:hypothetical protein
LRRINDFDDFVGSVAYWAIQASEHGEEPYLPTDRGGDGPRRHDPLKKEGEAEVGQLRSLSLQVPSRAEPPSYIDGEAGDASATRAGRKFGPWPAVLGPSCRLRAATASSTSAYHAGTTNHAMASAAAALYHPQRRQVGCSDADNDKPGPNFSRVLVIYTFFLF